MAMFTRAAENMPFAQSMYDSEELLGRLPFTDVRQIGSGSFGVVYSARLRGTNEMIAIKKVHKLFLLSCFRLLECRWYKTSSASIANCLF